MKLKLQISLTGTGLPQVSAVILYTNLHKSPINLTPEETHDSKYKVTGEAIIKVQKRNLGIKFKSFFSSLEKFRTLSKLANNATTQTSCDYFLPINTKSKSCYLLALTFWMYTNGYTLNISTYILTY